MEISIEFKNSLYGASWSGTYTTQDEDPEGLREFIHEYYDRCVMLDGYDQMEGEELSAACQIECERMEKSFRDGGVSLEDITSEDSDETKVFGKTYWNPHY